MHSRVAVTGERLGGLPKARGYTTEKLLEIFEKFEKNVEMTKRLNKSA